MLKSVEKGLSDNAIKMTKGTTFMKLFLFRFSALSVLMSLLIVYNQAEAVSFCIP